MSALAPTPHAARDLTHGRSIDGHVHVAEVQIHHTGANQRKLIISVLFALDERTIEPPTEKTKTLHAEIMALPGPRFLHGQAALLRLGPSQDLRAG